MVYRISDILDICDIKLTSEIAEHISNIINIFNGCYNNVNNDNRIILLFLGLYEQLVKFNIINAYMYYIQAIEKGEQTISYRQISYYYSYIGDMNKMVNCLLIAIKNGDIPANHLLAKYYMSIKDYEKAKHCLLFAVNNKYTASYAMLALCYHYENDINNMIKYNILGIEHKIKNCYINLFTYYSNIDNVEQLNYLCNQYFHGVCGFIGNYFKNKNDEDNMIKYYTYGCYFNELECYHNLGDYYKSKNNVILMLNNYNAAAKANYVPSLLALAYYYKSLGKTCDNYMLLYFYKAASLNNGRAMFELGEYYYNTNKHIKAIHYYNKATKLGEYKSMYKLTLIYKEVGDIYYTNLSYLEYLRLAPPEEQEFIYNDIEKDPTLKKIYRYFIGFSKDLK